MGPRAVGAGLCLLMAHGLRAEWTLEVVNGACAHTNWVVHQAVTREWARSAPACGLVELSERGVSPVPCALDASGAAPVLTWLMPGATAPDATRRFAWVPQPARADAQSDLSVCETPSGIVVSNGFFRLTHPARGGGGFPREIAYGTSGRADPDLFFYDRLVRPRATGPGLVSYCAKECEQAESRVVFRSPLRVTVEVRTGYGRQAAETPGRPQAVYRYVYSAQSPVVEVDAQCTRDDDGPWRELHFLHLSRATRGYAAFVAGDPASATPLQAKGARSRSVSGAQWLVMSDDRNACGVGFGGAFGWDASDEFVYYVRRTCVPWLGRAQSFSGGLYFGPSGDASWYSGWLGRGRRPEVRIVRDGKAWSPVEREPLAGPFELEGRGQRVVFGGAEEGFDCLGIENRLAGDARFVRVRAGMAGLWSLAFQAPAGAEGRTESVSIDNRSGAASSRTAERVKGGLVFTWRDLDLPGEPKAVDVCAEVRLAGDGASSEWRLRVTNRSRRYGLYQSEFPLLRAVVPAGVGDVLLPRGNWGGSLMRQSVDAYVGRYPSHGCPVQMVAFNLGEAGLCLAAHDGTAGSKEIAVTAEQDATFRVLAPGAGTPGTGGGPSFPVVVSSYAGDWWQAARLYRECALRQPWTAKGPLSARGDYPRRLTEIGFWMLAWGEPAEVSRTMEQAARLLPDLPLGVHWYGWHQIPFDNSYPDYFPTRPGMAETARALAAKGITVMPYINARLWDRDIPDFAAAYAAACKRQDGTNYVETYGSGRSLVPMCPWTGLWQDKVREVCGRLMGECGVGGIYLDQIGSAAPVACYDPAHGHPVGGGSHWVAGYHAMLGSVKAEAARRGVALTTEDSAEPYMDVIDGCLAWNPRYQEDVPLLPAIYSGYTTYFTSPQSNADSLDAFCAQQGRDFLWGCQLGWNSEWILKEESREKLAFQAALGRCRLAAKEFLVYGRLVDEVRPDDPVPRARQLWHRNRPHEASVPAVMGTVWVDARGERVAAFVVNASGAAQRVSFSLDPAAYLGRRGPWRLTLLDGRQETPLSPSGAGIVLGDLPPRAVRVVTAAPAR